MSVKIELAAGGSVTIYPGANFAAREAMLTVIDDSGDCAIAAIAKDEARHIGESLLAWVER